MTARILPTDLQRIRGLPSDVQHLASPRKQKFKYNNKPCVVDGIRFPSQLEAKRYSELKLLERTGEINGLRLQVCFDLAINGVHITTYRADFVYICGGAEVVEDAKGKETKEFAIKRRLMKAVHGIDVLVTKSTRL